MKCTLHQYSVCSQWGHRLHAQLHFNPLFPLHTHQGTYTGRLGNMTSYSVLVLYCVSEVFSDRSNYWLVQTHWLWDRLLCMIEHEVCILKLHRKQKIPECGWNHWLKKLTHIRPTNCRSRPVCWVLKRLQYWQDWLSL